MVRDDFDLPISDLDKKKITDDFSEKSSVSIDEYLGKVCDVSMNSFRYSVISQIVSCIDDTIEIHTGKFVAKETLDDISVILLSDKITLQA